MSLEHYILPINPVGSQCFASMLDVMCYNHYPLLIEIYVNCNKIFVTFVRCFFRIKFK